MTRPQTTCSSRNENTNLIKNLTESFSRQSSNPTAAEENKKTSAGLTSHDRTSQPKWDLCTQTQRANWEKIDLLLAQRGTCQGPFSAIAFGVGWESEQSWPVKKGSKLCNCKVHGPCNKHWRLVLGCIDAAFSNRIFWFQHVFLRGRKPSRNHRKPAKTNEIVNFLLRNRTFRFMQT